MLSDVVDKEFSHKEVMIDNNCLNPSLKRAG